MTTEKYQKQSPKPDFNRNNLHSEYYEYEEFFNELKLIAWKLYDLTCDFNELQSGVDELANKEELNPEAVNQDISLMSEKEFRRRYSPQHQLMVNLQGELREKIKRLRTSARSPRLESDRYPTSLRMNCDVNCPSCYGYNCRKHSQHLKTEQNKPCGCDLCTNLPRSVNLNEGNRQTCKLCTTLPWRVNLDEGDSHACKFCTDFGRNVNMEETTKSFEYKRNLPKQTPPRYINLPGKKSYVIDSKYCKIIVIPKDSSYGHELGLDD